MQRQTGGGRNGRSPVRDRRASLARKGFLRDKTGAAGTSEEPSAVKSVQLPGSFPVTNSHASSDVPCHMVIGNSYNGGWGGWTADSSTKLLRGEAPACGNSAREMATSSSKRVRQMIIGHSQAFAISADCIRVQ
jgi:hypothetical protein